MDLPQLNFFIKVVEEGSFSAAARKLYMSQPPLGRQIKRLEAELGTSLFIRDTSKMTLTDAGYTLYQRAKSILNMTAIAEKEVRAIAEGSNGILRLGTTSSSSNEQIQNHILEFHRQNPGVSFEIYEGDSYSLIELLYRGQLDVAFVRTPFPAKDVRSICLKTEPLLAVGQASFFKDCGDVTLAWLQNCPLIIYRRWEPLLRNAFHEKGLNLCPLCVNDNAWTSLSWASSGLGVALVPSSAIERNSEQSITTRMIQDLSITSSITLVINNNQESRIANNFFSFFSNQ
jgi:DNA-binding transcriptional LysR family regulator